MSDTTDIIGRIYKELKPYIVKDIRGLVSGAVATQLEHLHTGYDGSGQVTLSDIYVPVGNLIWRMDATGITWFAGSDAGFTAANSSADSGDVILLPPKTFTNSLTIADGIALVGWSRRTTIFTGLLTGAPEASIERLTISRTADDGDPLKGLVAPATGTFYIHGCDVRAVQAGAGAAYGLHNDVAGATIKVWNSYLYGESVGGVGNGTYRDVAVSCAIFVFGGHIKGSTDPCNE